MTREEAIRIIEANCSCTESKLREACAIFIPELRESEDEQVRKSIVATIKQCPDDFLNPKNRDRMLAYLERQKEQKELPLMDGNADLYFDEWNQRRQNPTKRQCFEEGIRYAKRLQKEQKQEIISISEMVSKYRNTDEYDDDGNYKGKPVNCMIRAYEQGIRDTLSKMKEQKSVEWSEEEKQKLNRIYVILGQAADTHAFSTTCRLIGDKEAVELQDFIRSIAKPQAQEWSKEDENKIERLAFLVSVVAEKEMISEEECIDLRRFVKSYRPSWKPSDEQIFYLSKAIKTLEEEGDCKTVAILNEIRLEIKKL